MDNTTAPTDREPDLAYNERLAADLEAMAALVRRDPAAAAMLAMWPGPISPREHYPRNGGAMATLLALRKLRVLAVREIGWAEKRVDGPGDHRAHLWVDIPMRARSLQIWVPVDDIAGYDYTTGEWHWDDDLVAELHRPNAAPEPDADTEWRDRWAEIVQTTYGDVHRIALRAGEIASSQPDAVEWTEQWARNACTAFDKLQDARHDTLAAMIHQTGDDDTSVLPTIGGDA